MVARRDCELPAADSCPEVKAVSQPISDERRAAIRAIRQDFIRRQFGDEIARVSRLSLDERFRYVGWMVDNARKHRVKFEKPARGYCLQGESALLE